jgi:hypothetical protein
LIPEKVDRRANQFIIHHKIEIFSSCRQLLIY